MTVSKTSGAEVSIEQVSPTVEITQEAKNAARVQQLKEEKLLEESLTEVFAETISVSNSTASSAELQ